MQERKILSAVFFSQLIELFHRTMKKKKKKIQLIMKIILTQTLNLDLDLVLTTFVTSCGAEKVNSLEPV